MHENLRWKILLIVIVVGGMGLAAYYMKIDLGLDLRGGAEILYRVHIEEKEVETQNVMGITLDVISRRINAFGVGEHRLERSGKDNILLQLPDKGEKEIARIKEIIKTTGKLTFHLVASEETIKKHLEGNTSPPGYVWKELVREEKNKGQGERLLIHEKADFLGDAVTNAQVVPWEGGLEWAVKITLNRNSRSRFARLTRDHKGERLAIVLDGVEKGKLYSAPVIKDEIIGPPHITGSFEHQEAQDLAEILLSGRLPAPISVEYESIVGPSLGQDSIRDGKRAILIGMAVVVAFMAVYYLGAGLVADAAVVCNLVILLGVLAYLDATLTLPGLAGIVLLVGMSVDANVLIFERVREEIAQGRPLSLAVRNAYRRVFVTIMDANLTTLFTAVILFWAGTGPVRGFAVTLGIGLLASMFTALFATRAVFDLLITKKIMSSFKMLSLIGKTSFDFSRYWKMTAVLSTVVILLGLSLYFQRGRQMYDIDFLGGGLIHIRFAGAQDIENVRKDIEDLGRNFAVCQVQSVWSPHEKVSDLSRSEEFEIRLELPEEESDHETFLDNAKGRLREKFAALLAEEAAGEDLSSGPFPRTRKISAGMAQVMLWKAIKAMVFAMVGIVIYMAFRFQLRFGIGAVVALIHDVLFTMGALAVAQVDVNLPIIAAFLTIVGYSLNDTIVVFDRMRENMRTMKNAPFVEIANLSINQTLGRTLLTSFTTLFAAGALFVWGGGVIHNFAYALIVGVIAGTYSSIFVASPIVVLWEAKRKGP